MKLEMIRQADYCLSKCGRPVPPDSATSVLLLARGIPIQIQLSQTQLAQTIARKVVGDADFELHSISIATPVNLSQMYFRVELPSGNDLFSAFIDIQQVAGYGPNRYVFTRPLICPLESRWILTFNTTLPVAANLQPIMVLFEGADRYVFTGGVPIKYPLGFASGWPRVAGDGNENILAPSWQQGFTLQPPVGWDFEPLIYASVPTGPGAQNSVTLIPGSPPFSTLVVGGPGGQSTGTAVIQIDQSNDFQVRRFLFDVQADPGVVLQRVLVRISAGSGYTLTEDYFDVEKNIGASPLAKPWDVKKGDQIFFDLQLVADGTGSPAGNVYWRAFADGVRKVRL